MGRHNVNVILVMNFYAYNKKASLKYPSRTKISIEEIQLHDKGFVYLQLTGFETDLGNPVDTGYQLW